MNKRKPGSCLVIDLDNGREAAFLSHWLKQTM